MQYWANGYRLPAQRRRPAVLSRWPSFVPITFEMLVLTAALTGLFGLFALCGLPRLHHPLFNVAGVRPGDAGTGSSCASRRPTRSSTWPRPRAFLDEPQPAVGRGGAGMSDTDRSRDRKQGQRRAARARSACSSVRCLLVACARRLPAADGRAAVLPAATSRPSSSRTAGRAGRWKRGVVHRGQNLDRPARDRADREEWGRFWTARRAGRRSTRPPRPTPTRTARPRSARRGSTRGKRRTQPKVYVDEFPFEITARRPEARAGAVHASTARSATGRSATGKGKIWERGFLKPTSFHTDARWTPNGSADEPSPAEIPLGYLPRVLRCGASTIPMRDVPVGYIFEVITKGYGGDAGLRRPDPAGRPVADHRLHPGPAAEPARRRGKLPTDVQRRSTAAGGKK